MKKTGFFGVDFGAHVDFWGKNGGGGVKLQQLGRIGRIKTFKNVQKRLKTFENIQKYSNFLDADSTFAILLRQRLRRNQLRRIFDF